MKPSELLIMSRDRLISNGWRTLQMGSVEGPNCAMGAVYHSDRVFDNDVHLRTKAYSYLVLAAAQTPSDKPWVDVGTWNDAINRTLQEVLDLFDVATSMAMSEECLED